MKARVKATGEIVEVQPIYVSDEYKTDKGVYYDILEIELLEEYSPDYWTRLEHQAAIATMGGICGNASYNEATWEDMAADAIRAAHALIQKLKKKEERK